MNVLVTGGTGYLGRAVVGALAARGHQVVVFARRATRAGLPGRAIDGDVRDAAAVRRAADGCDAVCHLAALVSVWRRRAADFDEVNVGGLGHVLDAAAALHVERVLYTSSFLALPPAGRRAPLAANGYQRTKVAADRLADERIRDGLPLVRVYPGVVYGPGAATEGNLVGRLIADHMNGRLPGLIGARHVWSYAFVDDVAAGHCAALERGRPGARYVLGGDNRTQRQMFALVARLTGRRPPRTIPMAAARAIGLEEEWRARIFGGAPLLTRGVVEILGHDWPLDSSESTDALGYRMTTLQEGLERTLAPWLRRGSAGVETAW